MVMRVTSRLGCAAALIVLVAGCTPSEGTQPDSTEADQAWSAPAHPITVRDGRFVDTRTGREFPVRGTNYFRLVSAGGGYQDRFFSPGVFDEAMVRRDLADLAARGYTTVRLFLDSCSVGAGCISAQGISGLNPQLLDAIAQTMTIARETGIFLLLTSNDLPDGGGYYEIANRANSAYFTGYRNTVFLTAAGAEAAATYWNDLMSGLVERRAAFDAVLGWSIINEQWVFADQPPLSASNGSVTGADGATYDLADPEQKRALVTAGVTNYIERVAEVIRRHDPNGLVTMGFFAPKFPNPTEIGGDWYVDTAPLLTGTSLDFFDFHAYPGSDIPLAAIAENFGLTGPPPRPIVMGEVGAFLDRFDTVEAAAVATQRWIAESCELGFTGWLYWGYLRAPEVVGDATWSLTDADGFLLDTLAPNQWPDPCRPTLTDPNLARDRPVRVSRALPGEPGSAAVDGNPATRWGAGEGAPQWIEVALAEPSTVGAVRLRVDQDPAGRTVHEVAVSGGGGGALQVVAVLDGVTAGGEVLTASFAPVEGVTAVRVTTRLSPSWVAWAEVEVLSTG